MRNLRHLRTDAGMSQQKLADKLGNGMSQSQICNYESGKYFPCLDTIIKIADIFNTTVDYLIGRATYDFMTETVNESGNTIKEQKIINRYRRYRESQQQSVEKFMDLLDEELLLK